ncbi:MAG: UDP-glucose 4-epimerase GalE [Lachnospiraceae bacterium]|nr:UDP-glucose 4-epimerase GalE [Lachnospiraceae bacterium]
MKILVTGGTGYIGSHTVVELINEGHDVVILDNLSNSDRKVVDRIEKITGSRPVFYEADILDKASLDKIFDKEDIEAVIHFAGLKAVGESVEKPLLYYENNISGTINLLKSMNEHSCKNIIFSSSATVYGTPAFVPITEECPKGTCTNPYGWTKSMIEQILMDQCASDSEWNAVLLRYFNPIGAHESGTIGENPNGIPNNLMPYVTQVAVGRLKELGVFGNDYDTHDGTGVRDYIHVVDLALGHVKALKKLSKGSGLSVYNLGTGQGYSVLDIVKNFEEATGVKIPYVIKPRRAGDIDICYADSSKAERELGWKAQRGIKEMCADSWRWQKNNPNGYDK